VYFISETAALLDAEEMESYDMVLHEKDHNPELASHTTSSYIVHCNDISPFFHDTWTNVTQESFPVVSTKSESTVFGAMGSLARNMRNSFRVPFKDSSADALDDFEDVAMATTPKAKKKTSFFEDER
jgi:hypothetical protein